MSKALRGLSTGLAPDASLSFTTQVTDSTLIARPMEPLDLPCFSILTWPLVSTGFDLNKNLMDKCELIPIEKYARKISSYPNTFVLGVFDCCREITPPKGAP